jgi:4-hydroxybenzoate polyprenyltransferase
MGFMTLTTVLMGLACLSNLPNAHPWALAISLTGVVGMAAHMLWQLRQLELENTETLLLLFRSNRTAGLVPVVFFALALLI